MADTPDDLTGMSDIQILEQQVPDEPVEAEETEESEEETTEEDSEGEEEPSEDEEEEPEEEPEEPEDVEPGQLKVQDVIKKYPNVFKEFPELKQNLFLARQFQELVDSPEQVKEAIVQANYFQYFQDRVLQGDAKEVLTSIKNSGDAKALSEFANNFLPALHEVDENTFYKISAPILQNALYQAVVEAEQSGTEDLAKAAKWIHRFIFGTTDIKKPAARQQRAPEIDAERQQLLEEKSNWERQRLGEAFQEVSGGIVSDLKKRILKDLDPKNEIQPYVKKKLVDDIIQETGKLLAKDPRHNKTMDSLWQRFKDSGMQSNGKTRIRDTYLARAIAVLPGVKSKLRAEALGRKYVPSSQNRNQQVTRPSGGAGKPQIVRTGKTLTPSKVDYSKTSDLDLISGKAVLKK
jgi:hypothetical protein